MSRNNDTKVVIVASQTSRVVKNLTTSGYFSDDEKNSFKLAKGRLRRRSSRIDFLKPISKDFVRQA
ncbi:hypothetical protein OLI36_003728 [Vibrio parahaemolyticus]|uniref:Uncharacterized protein n=1 Tax=Vibrio kanaloae TaxID=170673 RepID=A0A4U1YQU0_9VIBR|nr:MULTISPECIES: hypothetical protein [Vibrio]EKA4470180.1 hypothetical protein [Vibrio parahaemolyticus]MBE3902022.1 hypothetical protein [Vibrio parahaemolyticus]TKF22756.1 hypothetical protein FCV50_23520 [Vibrio kanaloae]